MLSVCTPQSFNVLPALAVAMEMEIRIQGNTGRKWRGLEAGAPGETASRNPGQHSVPLATGERCEGGHLNGEGRGLFFLMLFL